MFRLAAGASTGVVSLLAVLASAHAAEPAPAEAGRYALHFQATWVEQQTDRFRAPYAGLNSLTPGQGRETTDMTLYAGVRLWSGAEAWINPEADQGFGLDNTLGVAGFPSGEAYKVGRKGPYFRLPRLFVRDTLNLGDPTATAEAGPNQLAQALAPSRWVFTLGKFGVGDVFDVNRYAHDPRGDFLNWAVIDAGTFDYAADAWGFTVGASLERYAGDWTWRAGFFDLSDVPNSPRLEPGFHEFQLLAEGEHRHELAGQPGKLLLTFYENHGRMGRLAEALRAAPPGVAPDIAAVRRPGKRDGLSLDLEQAVSADAGVFARAGSTGGNVEAYEFTDIDRSYSAGVAIKGSRWHRPNDTLALAGVVNRISGIRERFLAAGGLGIIIGDGRLPHPGPEQILESYYQLAVGSSLQLTLDYQAVRNPAYNRDRGPVSIIAFRAHLQL